MSSNIVLGKERERLLVTLLLSSGVSLFFLLVRIIASGSPRFWFLAWNLLLAWVPLCLVFVLQMRLNSTPWKTWQNGLLALGWLAFLPNSFYIISDYIHIQSSGEVSLLFDVAMLTSFVINGLLLGYISLYIMHRLLLSKLSPPKAHAVIAAVLLGCSFAIYLGRYLRWNSWDVILSPAGLLFDISDRFINPGSHLQTFTTTLIFFFLLGSLYMVIYQLVYIIGSSYHKR